MQEIKINTSENLDIEVDFEIRSNKISQKYCLTKTAVLFHILKLCLIVFLGEGRALNFHTIIRPNLLIILGITKLPSIIVSICFLRHPLPVTQACFKRSAFHVSNAFKTIENELQCLIYCF